MNSGIHTKSEQTLSMQAMTVVKRNGTIVLFHKDRIIHALESAFRDTKKSPSQSTWGRTQENHPIYRGYNHETSISAH